MRKNHNKIVCIKLVHLPYLTKYELLHRSLNAIVAQLKNYLLYLILRLSSKM